MTDLNHVNDDRIDDAAADWTPEGDGFAASYDEWNAIRAHTGKAPGTFGEYLADIGKPLVIDPIVAMLARRWVSESDGAGQLPADWIDGPVPF